MQYWKLNPINCFGTSESIGKNETHPVAKRNFKFVSKGIAILIIVMIIFYIVNIVYKIFLINYLEERFKEYDNWNNYYAEIRSFEEGKLTDIKKIWYKGNRYKIITEMYLESEKNYKSYKWIDCNNETIISYDERTWNKSKIPSREIENIYKDGKNINHYLYWHTVIKNNKNNIIMELKPIYLQNTENETKLKIDKMTVNFYEDSIIPKLFTDQTNEIISYKYYNIQFQTVKDDDVCYRENMNIE